MLTKIIDITPGQTVYVVHKRDIMDSVINWERNRPEDPIRVKAIQAYNNKFNITFADGIVYAWYDGEHYRIYDGWTRYCAASESMKFFLSVNTTEFEQDIIHHFIALNSAVPVPSLFMEDTDAKKRKLVTAVVDHFCETYPQFLSASKRPQRPNFNRDTFTEQLTSALDALDINNFDKDRIIHLVEKVNTLMKSNCKDPPVKAANGNFYLFANKKTQWNVHFVSVLERERKTPSWLHSLKDFIA